MQGKTNRMDLLFGIVFLIAWRGSATSPASTRCRVVHQVRDAEEWRDVLAHMDHVLQKEYIVTDYCDVWHQQHLFVDEEFNLVRCNFPPSGLQYFFARREDEGRIVVSFPARYSTSFIDEVFGCC